MNLEKLFHLFVLLKRTIFRVDVSCYFDSFTFKLYGPKLRKTNHK